MKKILYISFVLLILSCGDEYKYSKGAIKIIQKREKSINKNDKIYQFYIYDGDKYYWYNTNEQTYNSYDKNDYLPTLNLK